MLSASLASRPRVVTYNFANTINQRNSTMNCTMQLRSTIAITGVCAIAPGAFAAGLILNEANCVGPRKWLANADSLPCECATGSTCSTEEDTFFGRRVGNGGDWVELVVTTDHLDIRGWQLRMAETDSTPGNADQANGTDLWYGSGGIEQSVITFSQNALWSDLRAGTIITIIENSTANGGLDTDVGFNPCGGDWWININASDSAYVSTQININLNSDGCLGVGTVPPGAFNVGNDSWEITIVNAALQTQMGPIGEAFAGSANWQGSGINSRETVRLSQDPSSSPGFYEDCDQSSFGHPNRWSETISASVTCPRFQDFKALRSWCDCDCVRVALNEYNAVGEDIFLNGGTAGADANGGQAADPAFGRVVGNGGDWFEVVVTDDHVDLRGATLAWEEVLDNQSGVITLSSNIAWSNLRAGTIITFVRRNSAGGGLDTNLGFSPWTGDRSINVWTGDVALIAGTTSTVGSHGFGDFHTSNDDWRLTIRNAATQLLSISSGEGSSGYGGRGIGNTETCDLQQNTSRTTRSWDNYNETIRSSFGAANSWKPCPGSAIVVQDIAGIVASTCTKAADVNASGAVNVADLLSVISTWGACTGLPCGGDVNMDGQVNVADLLAVISNWG